MAFFDSAAYDKHLLGLIYQYDLNLNCFPTLHAAHVLLIAFMFPKNELHLNRLFLKIWACLITASTMIIRQHSAADILGAITIVVIAIEIEKKWLRKLFQTPG